MNELLIKAPAKINLLLRIVDKYPDNYHKIHSLMQSVSLYDYIKITKNPEKKIIITSNVNELNFFTPSNHLSFSPSPPSHSLFLPLNPSPFPPLISPSPSSPLIKGGHRGVNNTAFHAAILMIEAGNLKEGVTIHLDKNIPLGSGMGGGSADAAGVIYGMNLLFEMDYSLKKLQKIGLAVGADVPFCLNGGLAFVYNKGEKLKPVNLSLPFSFVLVKPCISISTKWAYEEFDKSFKISLNPPHLTSHKIIHSLMNNNFELLEQLFINDMEKNVCLSYPIIKKIKNILKKHGALCSVMSGSGSTVVGVFSNETKALKTLSWFESKKNEMKLELVTIVYPVNT